MNNTPRNTILQIGALIALYASLSFLLTLVFGLINLLFPMSTESFWEIEGASSNVRMGIAMLVVFFPTFLILTRFANQYRRQRQMEQQSATRWLIYISLLVAGLVLLVTLVTTIYTFLNGDMTARFILKAGAVLILMAGAFYYYIQDVRDYWLTHESKSKWYGVGASMFVVTAIALGITNIASPAEVRELRLDEQQINDLRNIQWEIESYLETSTTSPATLDTIYSDTAFIPAAPDNRDGYSYEVTETGFKLCATFAHDSMATDANIRPFRDSTNRMQQAENWDYMAGRYCFERVVK